MIGRAAVVGQPVPLVDPEPARRPRHPDSIRLPGELVITEVRTFHPATWRAPILGQL